MYVLKLLVILVCYALSSLGILFAWVGGLTLSGLWQFMLVFWFSAAIAHLQLSLAWLDGRRLGKNAATIAGVLGLLGLLAFPMMLRLSHRESLELKEVLSFAGMELLAVLPAFLLAIYLTWYHASRLPLGRLGHLEVKGGNEA